MSLELELQADRLRRERLVQALAVLGATAGAAFMFWVFRSDPSTIETADGRVVQLDVSTGTWIRGHLWGLILVAIAYWRTFAYVCFMRRSRRPSTSPISHCSARLFCSHS